MKAAIAYTRVSTAQQGRSGLGLEAQQAALARFAEAEGFDLIETFKEVETGKGSDALERRPQLSAALEAARQHKAPIIVAKLDRLTRSVKDLCELLERFERRGVALISVAESLDTGSAAGRLVLNIMTAVSQWEREAIGERTRDALRHKRSNSERVGNIQFGYRLCAYGKHVVPDSSEQAIIAAIGDMRASGTSLRRIASDLNNRGFRTRRGSPWRLESIARVAAERWSCSA